MKRSFSALLLLAAAFARADGTEAWQQSKFEDFEKGRASGVAIRSDGALELAPSFKVLYTSPSTYLWAVASDKAGNIFAAAGAPARVYEIRGDGSAAVIFEPAELQVQALVERDGALYAATSPDGKVYKLTPPAEPAGKTDSADAKKKALWNSAVYFDPKTKYIWDLALDSRGDLYVATGDPGAIFTVTPEGQGSQFFQSDEAHIRALAIDAKDDVIAGSDGSGLVYRISPVGEAFVLYSADKKEITALAVDKAGNIFAAGAGEKRAVPAPASITIVAPVAAPAQPNAPSAPPPQIIAAPSSTVPGGGSEIYKIAADGSPSLLWSSHDDLVYALAVLAQGGNERGEQLIAGTGNKGRIIAIAANDASSSAAFSDLLHASANQVTGFAPAAAGGLFLCTANLGKILQMGPDPAAEGSFESDVFDAHLFSRWGRAEVRGRGNYQLLVRSGNVDNPDRNWSPWKKVDAAHASDPIPAPPARFAQWQAKLHDGSMPPRLESVALNYLTKNVAPVVEDVEVQLGPPAPNAKPGESQPAPANPTARATNVTVHWNAHDDNDDQLSYSLFYRGDGESNWKPLTHANISEKTYNFDPSLLPDGGYRIRVVASDAASHSTEEALTGDGESPRFELDSTPPRIEALQATLEAESKNAAPRQLHVTFRAADSFSVIHRAEYSLDA
ncbi:MAG TPA: hypothetical protein VGR50_07350, partial [Terriglobales bacterium]|nr:hypothetical protein [Terriglobales bacterium]